MVQTDPFVQNTLFKASQTWLLCLTENEFSLYVYMLSHVLAAMYIIMRNAQ